MSDPVIELKNLLSGQTRISEFIKENKRLPTQVTLKRSDNRQVNYKIPQYMGIYRSFYQFHLKNNRYPNFVTPVYKADTSMIQNYQDNKYNCGPSCLSMISSKLFKYVTESAFAKACNTNKNGTSPANLIKGAKDLGFIVEKIERNRFSVERALSQAKGVIAHIDTIKAPCLKYSQNYGHWIVLKNVLLNDYIINDPTKGENLECRSTQIDYAMKDRKINYYSVELA